MNRVKFTFVALLPAFCLVVMGQVILVPCDGCGWIVPCESRASVDRAKECPSQPLPVADSAIGAVHSRLVKQSFKTGDTEGTLAASALVAPAQLDLVTAFPANPDISAHWLVTCRKALPPRAPCFVS